jgi:alpha-galactosidase
MRPIIPLFAVLVAGAACGASSTWQLATDDTRIALGVVGDQPVITRLECPSDGHNWAAAPMAVPLMAHAWVGGVEHPTAWRFREGVQDRRAGTVCLVFASDDPKLELRSIWRARPGRGPVERWVEIRNLGAQRVAIGQQESLSLANLTPGEEASVWWIRRGGSNASTEGGTAIQPLAAGLDLSLVSNCEDGASPAPWLAVQVGEQRGLYVGWEFSGLGRVRARASQDGRGLELNVGLNPDFKTDIEPGETFLVPPAFVGCYSGDIDAGSYSLHKFILDKLRPRMPRGCPDPTLAYNPYMDVGTLNATEADVLRGARLCHDLGFETYVNDAMWFPGTGDWRWDPARFPRGVAPITDYVHRNGMRMGLWCAWTNGGVSPDPGALSVRGPNGHPDWFRGDVPADWQPGPFWGAQVCLGCPEALAWEREKTQWLVRHHGLDYLKHDCGPIVMGCDRTDHRHHYGVDASYWATMGYYQVQEDLRREFPGLILENCSGGGHIKDFGVIQRTHYTVATDTLSNLADRQSIWDSSFAFPPVVMQAYSYDNVYPVEGDNPGPFLWRSAMMSAWQIAPTDTVRWTSTETDSVRSAVQAYKDWIRPILGDCVVHHVLPRPDGKRWDGLFYWSPSLLRGTLYVFRPDSPESRQTVTLKGLDPAGRYWVWSEDGAISAAVRTGERLIQRGLALRLPGRYTSDLVYVQDASRGKPEGLEPPGSFRLRAARPDSDAFAASATLTWAPSANARSYRVLVSDTADFAKPLAAATVSGCAATLPKLPAGRALYWRVDAVSWGGVRAQDGDPGRLITPALKPLKGIVFVSDMPWVRSSAGADNVVHRDETYNGHELRIAGKPYPKGLWTHSFADATPADVVLDIAGRGFAFFAADVGVEDAAGGGTVQFQVLVDGVLKAETPVLRLGMMRALRVDVSGAREVILRVLNGGDGNTCDHSAWGFARFVKAGEKDPLGDGKG